MRAFFRRNAIALAALFVALGGTAVAATVAKNSVTSKSIKKGAVKSPDVADNGLTGVDIDEGTLSGIQGPRGEQGPPGDPGPKGDPGDPGPSTGPAGGDLQGSYPNPTLKGGPAVTLATGLAPAIPPGCHDGFGNPVTDTWGNLSDNVNNPAGYYRDPLGRVHLQGVVTKCGNPPTGNTVFTLPTGFRPSKLHHFGTVAADAFGAVNVDANGPVTAVAGNFNVGGGWISLDGLSFRCGPSGQNGCP